VRGERRRRRSTGGEGVVKRGKGMEERREGKQNEKKKEKARAKIETQEEKKGEKVRVVRLAG